MDIEHFFVTRNIVSVSLKNFTFIYFCNFITSYSDKIYRYFGLICYLVQSQYARFNL